MTAETQRYYYDGVNEVVETDAAGTRDRYYVHGVSYVDERLTLDMPVAKPPGRDATRPPAGRPTCQGLMMMNVPDDAQSSTWRPYYYVVDRMPCP